MLCSDLDIRRAISALAVTAGGCAAISDVQQTRDFLAQGQYYYRSRRIAVAVPRDIAMTMPLDAGSGQSALGTVGKKITYFLE
ncbi:hypothetical protein RhoFasGS6_01864 [Rhodococcus fascians]|uniref:hypothetical protein n=1 Tax=Rhodococcoides fascians TaxID=1828 RepID=UPI001427C952|nr:hypothetical protein [Rhodococcus fascians]